jgi:serine/threonine protein kinase
MWLLGKTIGEGTFGKVRLGIHQPTGEKVTYPYPIVGGREDPGEGQNLGLG